jgi:hypothetical protein
VAAGVGRDVRRPDEEGLVGRGEPPDVAAGLVREVVGEVPPRLAMAVVQGGEGGVAVDGAEERVEPGPPRVPSGAGPVQVEVLARERRPVAGRREPGGQGVVHVQALVAAPPSAVAQDPVVLPVLAGQDLRSRGTAHRMRRQHPGEGDTAPPQQGAGPRHPPQVVGPLVVGRDEDDVGSVGRGGCRRTAVARRAGVDATLLRDQVDRQGGGERGGDDDDRRAGRGQRATQDGHASPSGRVDRPSIRRSTDPGGARVTTPQLRGNDSVGRFGRVIRVQLRGNDMPRCGVAGDRSGAEV